MGLTASSLGQRKLVFGRASPGWRMPGPVLIRRPSVWGLVLTLVRRRRRGRLLSLVQLLGLFGRVFVVVAVSVAGAVVPSAVFSPHRPAAGGET